MSSRDEIKRIIHEGTSEERLALFQFSEKDSVAKILKKFELFTRSQYPRYFGSKSAPFHREIAQHYIEGYLGIDNWMELAFRGAAKTSILKLFVVFVILNDIDHKRKFMKILSKDGKNSKQMVTDIYNMIVEVQPLYGDIFEKDGDKKREETMNAFTTKDGRRLSSGTVGQTQRGHLQDAYRPDFVMFEDIEDRESISSAVITQGIILKCDEAITGLAKEGNFVVNGNYISEDGVIEWFKQKESVKTHIVPIQVDDVPTWDIYTKEDILALKADAEDFWGEYMCLHPDTGVLTPDGWVKISEIRVGDLVITHRGNTKKVLRTFVSQSEELLDIHVGKQIVTITSNHPVLAIRYGVLNWYEAGELSINDLVVKIPRGILTE